MKGIRGLKAGKAAAAVLPVMAAVFLTGCGFAGIPGLFGKGNKEASPEEVAKEIESVDFDQENGLLYVNSDVILVAKEAVQKKDILRLAEENDAEADTTMSDIGVYRLIYDDAMTYGELDAAVQELRKDPRVENAHFNVVTSFSGDESSEDARPAVYPEDSWEDGRWDTARPKGKNWGMEAVNAPAAWGYLDDMEDTSVGIIDSMPDTDHPDLSFEEASCLFVDTGSGSVEINKYPVEAGDHGTHVSGIIGADWNNRTGTAGIMGNRGKLYYTAVYYDNDGEIVDSYATAYSYILAIKELIERDVRVINISQNTGRLVGFAASRGNRNAVRTLKDQAELAEVCLDRIIRQRDQKGCPDFVICTAAGNSNSTEYYKDDNAPYGYSETPQGLAVLSALTGEGAEKGGSLALYNNFLNLMDLPGVKDRVIVVGAAGIDGEASTEDTAVYRYSDFSNVGDRVDIVAPGENIYSCIAGGYGEESGTSMAAPHVSGAAGLVFAANPELKGPDVKNLLVSSAAGRYYYEGGCSGMVDAAAAVESALKTRIRPVESVLTASKESALDLCFVIDTTGSMNDDIDNARDNMREILETLSGKTSDYRVALVDYRDFADRTLSGEDYPARVRLSFSSSDDEIFRAINSLDLGYGGDDAETVYSGLMTAAGLPWRTDAEKVIIILGDAPPLDPEPETGYTYQTVINTLREGDITIADDVSGFLAEDSGESGISVYSIGTEPSAYAEEFFKAVSLDTGGSYSGVEEAEQVSGAIMESIEKIEVVRTVSAEADFGSGMAESGISLYRDGAWLFSFRTDEEGRFFLEDMLPGTYGWKCAGKSAEGSIVLTEGSGTAEVKIASVPKKHSGLSGLISVLLKALGFSPEELPGFIRDMAGTGSE